MVPIKNSITITQLVLLFAFFFLCLSAREITCPVCHAEECKGGEIHCFYHVVQFYQFIEAHRLQERGGASRERENPEGVGAGPICDLRPMFSLRQLLPCSAEVRAAHLANYYEATAGAHFTISYKKNLLYKSAECL